MGSRFAFNLLAIIFAAELCGCRMLLKPGQRARQQSFDQGRNILGKDSGATPSQTCFVFSGAWTTAPLHFDSATGNIEYETKKSGSQGISQGLAVRISSDGYLLTAGHAIGKKMRVFGWFNGKTEMLPARRVYQGGDSKHYTDIGIIKVDARVNRWLKAGQMAKIGDPVVAEVCDRPDESPGGEIKFAAGKLVSILGEKEGGSMKLIDTTIPLWKGDSGGPLLNRNGKVIGINTGGRLLFHSLAWRHQNLSVIPDRELIESIIQRDRARNSDPTSSSEN